MADTATTRYKARKQSLGSNTNTWGDTKLNDNLDIFDRGSKGYSAVALTGDVTWSWTNYSTSNAGQVAVVKFTGSLSSAAVVTVPATEWVWLVWNAAGNDVTMKTSGGTGVTIPNGHRALVYNDGSDCVNIGATLFPTQDLRVNGKISNLTAGTANTDAVNKVQLDNAIAAATTSTTAGTARVTSSDTTAKFINSLLEAGQGISQDVQNSGANETLRLSTPTHNGVVSQTITGGTVAMTAGGLVRITAGTGTLPTLTSGQFLKVQMKPAAGTTVTIGRNSQTIDGVAEDDNYTGDGGLGLEVIYSYVSAGAVRRTISGFVGS